ncbi:hypothetical protein IE53DRAFT_117374 [Violaceomyces palustris]|uniref:Uncharacterized protein n=1 Tax=Violaceomyces palustris TaxID=1673888 RepID=A0ACD0P6Q0_9BASI|nr:hypothetical protein IE53DRAFT_117374 [Violaceomyces palustris]
MTSDTLSPTRSHFLPEGETRHKVTQSLGKPHFSIDPSTIAESKPIQTSSSPSSSSSSSSSSASSSSSGIRFGAIPRNSTFDDLLPIISRLPLEEGEQDPLLSQSRRNLDYIRGPGDVVPYTISRLPELDQEGRHLWRALHKFRTVTKDYAKGYLSTVVEGKDGTLPTQAPHPISNQDSIDRCPAFSKSKTEKSRKALEVVRRVFNWDQLPDLPEAISGQWYGVIFRSARRQGSESVNLYEDDRLAHEEAVESGGLIMYWYGAPDPETGENVATCIWTNRRDAIKASRLPQHAVAAKHSPLAFSRFDLTRYSVKKYAGEKRLRIEEWDEEEEEKE